MSTARGFSPLDIMTLGDFRGANEAGDGLVVLAPELDSVLWANQAGRVLLGLSDDRPSLSPTSGLSRQIRATARLIETRGEARLLLRPATGLAAQPVVADLRRVATRAGVEVVILAAAAVRPVAASLGVLADRLLRESGLEDAAIYGRDGTRISSAAANSVDDLPAEIAALLDSDLPQRVVDRADARLTLARVARDLVLVWQDQPGAPEPAAERSDAPVETPVDAPAPGPTAAAVADEGDLPSEPTPSAPALESLEATSMSAIVRRWHSRGTPTGLAPAWRPAGTPDSPEAGAAGADSSTPAEAGADAAEAGTDAAADVPRSDLLAFEQTDTGPADTVAADSGPADAGWMSTRPTPPEPSAALPQDDEVREDGISDGPPEAVPAPAEPTRQRSIWAVPAADGDAALDLGADPFPASVETAEPEPAGGEAEQTDADGLAPILAQAEADKADRPSPPAPMRPLRSAWGAPVESAAPPLPAAPESDAGDRPRSEDDRPMPETLGDRDRTVPNDAPVWGDGESAPSVEKPIPAVPPDTVPETPADLDETIDEDLEVPAEEDLCPGGEERSRPEGLAPTTMPEEASPAAMMPVAAPEAVRTAEEPRLDEAHSDAAVATAPAPTTEPPAGRQPFVPSFSGAPVRFVWQIDRDGKFRSLTPEFSAAVGAKAADVAGRSFREVADVFGFDTSGEISRLLERRDTWSGRSILWPVEASDRKVPVDLAALPVYARDRSFDGFRGFGIVRMNESVPDPDAIGMILADFGAFTPDVSDAPLVEISETLAPDAGAPNNGTPEAGAAQAPGSNLPEAPGRPLLTTFEAATPPASFGRRPEPPLVPAASPDARPDEDAGEPKVIRLEERRRPRDAGLSLAEEAAFRAIGATLGRDRAKAPRDERGGPAEEPAAEAAEARAAGAPAQDASPATVEDMPAPALGGTESFVPSTTEPAEPAEPARPADMVALPAPAQQNDVLPGVDGGPSHDAEGFGDDALTAGAKADAAGSSNPTHDATTVSAPASETAVEETASTDFGADETDEAAEAPSSPLPAEIAAEIEAIFATLPLPMLVQMNEKLIYANREFQDLSGYADLAALEAAGGLDALFAEPADGVRQGELAIRRSNGQIADVRVHMQRATFGGRSCLMMSFSPSPREIAAVAATPSEPGGPAVEADLRQQVEELQAVLDTATDGIVLLDPAGIIRAMNGSAHALFGLGPDAHSGLHLSSLFAPESQQATLDYLEMLREEGLAGILNDGREVIGQVAQGGAIPLFITIGRLSGERGWCVVIRDIAHWKRIEEDLVNARRQAEAASLHKSRFLANISHELRTPLNAIIGFADVMASECFGPIGNERYIEYLGDIKRSGHHVLDLVNDLLDISKIEAGKLDLAFEAVSLNEVIAEVVSLMQPQANRERVIVRSNLPSSVPPVVADRRTMRQIALNLIANAIRFTPAGGQIIASTTYTADGEVLLRFRDSGIGMSEREIDIALTPFQQVHPPGATRGEGTGLGLPLTKAMVEANRANFAISSAPGEGTLVEIAFPSQRVLAD
ncbi:histidine kinase dimerization/phospho-acceptor domain-containing protein [Aureimonas glaciei]|uniref:histidine kinase n=1 Tax=Aureimonas glaciei TaxID=1776957 RepID=A0A917D6E5_9HYPH|nr:histidine kinase dimerization/phospho-acceptor domain-containing protein [Aureimonas glaciei]GGD06334.1 hypothetical protein GCM10011335_06590 [Aureimonas glaciei]